MTVIRRINPASAFKVGFVVYGLLGLILGGFCTLASIAGVTFTRQMHSAMFGSAGVYIGFLAVILCPIVYGLIGGIGATILAFVYNLASGWIGGLEVDITS